MMNAAGNFEFTYMSSTDDVITLASLLINHEQMMTFLSSKKDSAATK